MSEEEVPRFDANADYGVRSGYFVRLDITPEDNFGRYPCACKEAGGQVWIGLTSDEALALAARLESMARHVADARKRHLADAREQNGETGAHPR
jgi:hypothetical protein